MTVIAAPRCPGRRRCLGLGGLTYEEIQGKPAKAIDAQQVGRWFKVWAASLCLCVASQVGLFALAPFRWLTTAPMWHVGLPMLVFAALLLAGLAVACCLFIRAFRI